MKEIKVVLPDGYDDAMTITAIGHTMGAANVQTNVMVRAADLTGHDGDMFVMRPHESGEWRKTETGWIPVAERLPEGMQEVLVFTETLQMKKALYNCAYKSFDELSSNGYRKIGNVSHWMPLPEPPEVRIWEKL